MNSLKTKQLILTLLNETIFKKDGTHIKIDECNLSVSKDGGVIALICNSNLFTNSYQNYVTLLYIINRVDDHFEIRNIVNILGHGVFETTQSTPIVITEDGTQVVIGELGIIVFISIIHIFIKIKNHQNN